MACHEAPSSSTNAHKTDENIPTSTQTQLLKRTPLDLSYRPINSNASEGDLAAEVSSSLLEIPLNPVTPFSIRGTLSARSATTPSMFATLSKLRPVLPTPSSIYGPFYLPDGDNLTFRQLATGQWQATVQDWLQRAEEMPVVCKGNVAAILSELQGAIDVRSRIHILEPVQDAKCVYVGALGCAGRRKKIRKTESVIKDA